MRFAYVPLGQTERDVNRRTRIDGAAVRLRGLETNAECRPLGLFVQAVTQAAHDTQHMDVASGREFEIERHRAFDAGASRIVRIFRCGLEDDFDRPVDWRRAATPAGMDWRTRRADQIPPSARQPLRPLLRAVTPRRFQIHLS